MRQGIGTLARAMVGTPGTSGTSKDVPSRPKTWFRSPFDRWCHVRGMGCGSAETGIGDGPLAATPACREAATQPPIGRYVAGQLLRVRAFMRVTRRAKRSACSRSVGAGGSSRLTRHGGSWEPVALLSGAGGPSPLTEDRQKPKVQLQRPA